MFSFDVEISCKYTKETPVVTPVNIPAVGSVEDVSYDIK